MAESTEKTLELIIRNITDSNRKFFSGRRCLVTGGAGFIGSWLVKALVELGAKVSVVDNLWRGRLENLYHLGRPVIDLQRNFLQADLQEYHHCLTAVRGAEIVFHLADIVGGINFVFSNENFVFRTNILINTNTVTAAACMGVSKYVYVGTACSYPKHLQMSASGAALVEEQAYPANPESGYGWSKLMGEYEAELAHKTTGLEVGILRLHNAYGPVIDYSPEKSQVIPSLIRKAVRHPNEEYIVWGSGNQARSFIFVSDIVRALLLVVNRGMNQGPIQIGSPSQVSIGEIARKIVRISQKPIPIEFDTTKPEGDIGRVGDCSKAHKTLDWKPEVDLDTGLALTYQWIQEKIDGTASNC